MPAVAGLRGTGDWGTDERPKNFRENILFYQPNGTAPIFALTSKAGKKTVDDPEFSWWNEPNTLVRLQVNGALSSSDTTFTVDSADPTATTPGVNWGTAQHLKPGDLLLVEPVADSATFNQELVQVESVLSATQFTARRGAGGTTAAAISDNIFLTLIGSAFAEGTAAPQAASRNPIKYTNYTQIFKDSYEITGTADETRARTGSPWSNDKKRKMFDHARAIEESILWGRKAETTGSNGKPLRFMGGMREFIPASNTTVFGALQDGAARSAFIDAVSPVFDFDTGAGDTRVCFAGNAAITQLGELFQADTQVRMNSKETFTMYGIDFQQLILPRGRIMLKSHPLLNQHSLYKNSMFIMDFDAVRYVALKNRDTKTKDDVQNDDEDVRRGFIQTECSLMVDYGGITCAYLGGINNLTVT